MGSIPLPALDVQQQRPPSALEAMQRMEAIKGERQQQQVVAQQQADQKAMTAALSDWDGKSYDELAHSVVKNGGSGNAAFQIMQHGLTVKKQISDIARQDAETGGQQLQNLSARHDQALGAIKATEDLPDDQLPGHLTSTLQSLVRNQVLKPEEAAEYQQLTQLPPDQMRAQLKLHEKQLMGEKAQIEQHKTQVAEEQKKQEMFETARHNQAMENKVPITEAELASKAAAGDPLAEAALKRLDKSKLASRPVSTTNIMNRDDAKEIADAIQNGDQPPTLTGLYRNAGPVRAELARRGVPLARMETDWKAVQKHISTLNGPQQERLRQSIESANGMLDKIDGLYAEWSKLAPTSGFKMLNRGALVASKNLPGRTGAVATALDAQIADLTADLGNVYMGGNSPTDHSLSLAGQNLKSEWNEQTFKEAIKQARENLKIRQNSIFHSQPMGVSENSPYMPKQQETASTSNAETRTYQGHSYAKQPDGSWKLQ